MSSHSLKPGDRVCFHRKGYNHYAVYTGDGNVIHMTGRHQGKAANCQPRHLCSIFGVKYEKSVIRMDKLLHVANGDKFHKDNRRDRMWRPLKNDEIVDRAKKLLDKTVPYNLFNSNCECLANWCRYDRYESDQVREIATGVTTLCDTVAGDALLDGLVSGIKGCKKHIYKPFVGMLSRSRVFIKRRMSLRYYYHRYCQPEACVSYRHKEESVEIGVGR